MNLTKNPSVSYLNDIKKIAEIDKKEEQLQLEEICKKYAFRANKYYLDLIDWDNPDDPIKKIIIPAKEELEEWGKLDACNESSITVQKGIQHKYPYTVLLLCNETCGGFCRYCFRKRVFMDNNDEISLKIEEGLKYIKNNSHVTNVLLTGGDPLLLSTKRLSYIFSELRKIPHVGIIRIGSKIPAFNPMRIYEDEELLAELTKFSTSKKRIYLMTHFDHPNEITEQAVKAIDSLIKAGVILCNQCPMLKGINDNPEVLSELYRKLSFIGCPPYYLFQGRPTEGNFPYRVPIVEGYFIFEEAKKRVSGLARRAKFVMSHETGKIEILGVDNNNIYLKYHRAKNQEMLSKILIFKRNDDAYWLEDLEQIN